MIVSKWVELDANPTLVQVTCATGETFLGHVVFAATIASFYPIEPVAAYLMVPTQVRAS